MDVVAEVETLPGERRRMIEQLWEDVHSQDETTRVWAWRELSAIERWCLHGLKAYELTDPLLAELATLTELASLMARSPRMEKT